MKKQPGFTMIEILVVIGVLVLLMVIVVVGLGGLTTSNRERSTKTILSNLRSLLAEFETAIAPMHLQDKQPDVMYLPQGTAKFANNNYDIWKWYVAPTSNATPNAGNHWFALYGDTSSRFGPVMPEAPERYASPPLLNTQLVLEMIESVPACKAMLSAIPTEARMEAPSGSTSVAGGRSLDPAKPRLVTDAWHNPIVFVPASGIEVTVKLATNQVGKKLVRAPDKRPFWASSGPDGMFTDPEGKKAVGEDNVYSFDN